LPPVGELIPDLWPFLTAREIARLSELIVAFCSLYAYTEYMTRTSLFLTKLQLAKLKAISAKTGLPVAELIRRALDAFLKSEGK
jgi:Ribbon-helix-helix domain